MTTDQVVAIVDVSNPVTPREVSGYDLLRSAVHVFVASGYIYVADGEAGLLIFRYDRTM